MIGLTGFAILNGWSLLILVLAAWGATTIRSGGTRVDLTMYVDIAD
jgi:hypothetical protein